MAMLVCGALVVCTVDSGAEPARAERVQAVAETVKCPTCRSQSVANSDAPAAVAIVNEIERRIGAGESPDQVRSFLATQYGEDILLTPTRSGLAGVVWVLPVAALVLAVAGLAYAFRRWRTDAAATVTAADRERVARARRQPQPTTGP
ncbi:hypothetical protein BH24ACT3_BH24ACT3_08780 [soil metagenome]